jgi:hypothetical protein
VKQLAHLKHRKHPKQLKQLRANEEKNPFIGIDHPPFCSAAAMAGAIS